MRNSVSILLGLLVVFLSGSYVHAQGDKAQVDKAQADKVKTALERRNDRLKTSFRNTLNSNKAMAESRIANRVAEINRVANLDDAQLRKLQIAAKGAVQSYMEKQDEEIVARAKQLGFEFDPAAEPEENEGNQVRATVSYGTRTNLRSVENEKIWQTSLENVLSAEQNETYKNLLQERVTSRENLALDLFISRADMILLLSPEQRQQLRDVIGPRYGDQLTQKLDRQFTSVGLNTPRFKSGKEEVDTAMVDNILSEAQIEQWKRSFGSEVKAMEMEIARREVGEK